MLVLDYRGSMLKKFLSSLSSSLLYLLTISGQTAFQSIAKRAAIKEDESLKMEPMKKTELETILQLSGSKFRPARAKNSLDQ